MIIYVCMEEELSALTTRSFQADFAPGIMVDLRREAKRIRRRMRRGHWRRFLSGAVRCGS